VIGFFLIAQVPDASDMRSMALAFRPIDRFVLGFESAESVIRMILDDIVLDRAALRSSFGARFNVNVRHVSSPASIDLVHTRKQKRRPSAVRERPIFDAPFSFSGSRCKDQPEADCPDIEQGFY